MLVYLNAMSRNPRLRLRRHLQELERARQAVENARANRADPWRVSELQLRYDRLNETVLSLELDGDIPAMRTTATPVPLPREPRRG